MAVGLKEFGDVKTFEDWYDDYDVDRDGCIRHRGLAKCSARLWSRFEDFKREHAARTQHYWKYETMADAEVVSHKADLPNVSDGTIAGMVRRTARNVVQHTPNVEIVNEFDDDKPKGILANYILRTKIIGDELNSNEMQQSLFASVMTSFTLGFDAAVPVLRQRADKNWVMEYDTIHYRDVFPEPGVKDVRKSPEVFIRRYLSRGEVIQLIRSQATGWDPHALKTLLQTNPPARQRESVPHQERKHGRAPDGYEIVTWYNSYGDNFLTFDANTKLLLRIEKNVDLLKRHPVFFLVLEKDPLQPLGKSQVALVFGRQEFGDLMLNGSMKLWYRNINPTIVGYGTGLNGVPNMSPGKYLNVPNPNAKLEPFEVNTQTLLQYGSISQQNQGAMINLTGAADQQMAAQAGHGMSATPQGVEAQESMVDITTNNYQKAVEYFFSKYCSYALTVYFQEVKGLGKLKPSADTRRALIGAGMPEELFDRETGELDIDLSSMAVEYNVRCVPGSLVELEDEKQLRILNQLFVPLSQAMPAIANAGDPALLSNIAAAFQFIVQKEIEMSGSSHAQELAKIVQQGPQNEFTAQQQRVAELEARVNELTGKSAEEAGAVTTAVSELQEQMRTLTEMNSILLQKLGVSSPGSTAEQPTTEESSAVLSVV